MTKNTLKSIINDNGKDEEQEQEKAADLYYYLIFKEIKDKLFNKMGE